MVRLGQAIFTKLRFVQQGAGVIFRLQTFSTETPSFAASVVSTGTLAPEMHPFLGMEKRTRDYESSVQEIEKAEL